LIWEETAEENTFRLILDAGIVRVEQVSAPENSRLTCKLSLLNETGTLVESFVPGLSRGLEDDARRQLEELYEMARNSALKPGEFLRQLEQEVIRRSG
jgi:hypothetical protein